MSAQNSGPNAGALTGASFGQSSHLINDLSRLNVTTQAVAGANPTSNPVSDPVSSVATLMKAMSIEENKGEEGEWGGADLDEANLASVASGTHSSPPPFGVQPSGLNIPNPQQNQPQTLRSQALFYNPQHFLNQATPLNSMITTPYNPFQGSP